MVRTPHCYCRGPGFNPWLGNYNPTSHDDAAKKKEKKQEHELTASANLPLVNFYPYLLSLLKELKEQHPFEDAKVL